MNYEQAGVDVNEADRGITRIINNIKSTWPLSGFGRIGLDVGYFANVIDFGGVGLAVTTDGVGSKTMIADLMNDYETIGIDCVAMNVNDLICVGARPVSMVDYIGVEYVDADVLAEISVGLTRGAKQAGISICGGEVSQLPDTITGFDLVGTAFGRVDLDKINVGETAAPGDVIIGLASSGIHSNGLTLARRILFDENKLDPTEDYELDDGCLGYELLQPTAIYVTEILDLLECLPVKALVNITGDGLLNLNRIKAEVSFVIDQLPELYPIFEMIQRYGDVTNSTMYQTFNMGVGFCIIVATEYERDVIDIMERHKRRAFKIGHVADYDVNRTVHIPRLNLVGHGKQFVSTKA
jgi:phosphoribosylformylglycinamidine cyclo-ligase